MFSMATFLNCISFLLSTILLFSLHINARDSQFFSKVTHDNINSNNNIKETEFPNNKGPVYKPEQQPVFIPETDNSYGLYGHESGQNPPTTTTTTNYQPYTTESEEDTSKYPKNNYYNYNKDAYNTNQNEMSNTRLAGSGNSNNNYYYYNKDAYGYGGKQNQLSDTRYTEGTYNSMANNQKYSYSNNAGNDRYHYNNNNAANDRYDSYNNNAANNRYNGERQGISDTRFMEGGKYFYDVNSEKYNYNPTLHGDSSRQVNSENWYNNRGYFGNNYANSYKNKNSMEGYQNQERFEDDQDDFQP